LEVLEFGTPCAKQIYGVVCTFNQSVIIGRLVGSVM